MASDKICLEGYFMNEGFDGIYCTCSFMGFRNSFFAGSFEI